MITNSKIKVSLLAALGAMVIAAPALAATTVSFSPTSVNVAPNRDFSVTIAVNPQAVKNYSVSLELNFPADLVQLKSFSFAEGWMPLSQPGYNTVDNTNGILVKTAGYAGGLSEAMVFGTAVFTSKQSGNSVITLNTVKSQALDGTNTNVISTAPVQVAVTVASVGGGAVTPTPVSTTPTTPATTPAVGATTPEEEAEQPATETIGEEVATTGRQALIIPPVLLAQISELITLGTGDNAVGVLVIAAVVVILYLIYGAIRKMGTRARKGTKSAEGGKEKKEE